MGNIIHKVGMIVGRLLLFTIQQFIIHNNIMEKCIHYNIDIHRKYKY